MKSKKTTSISKSIPKVKTPAKAPKSDVLSTKKQKEEAPEGANPLEQIKHYVKQVRRGNKVVAKLYENGIMHNAFEALNKEIEDKNLTLFTTTVEALLSKTIEMVNQHCFIDKQDKIPNNNQILCKPKNSLPITQDQRQVVLELLANILTYMIKSEKHGLTINAFNKELIAPEAPSDIEVAKKQFDELYQWASTSSYQHLDKLPGRGISFPFTGDERMKVGKNRLKKNKGGDKIVVSIKHPSPKELLSYETIGHWRHLRGLIRDNLDLTMASEKQSAHFLNITLNKVIKNTFQSRSTLVQDFSPGAAKYLTTLLYPQTNNLVGCDPFGGWGDRLVGWLATKQMAELHINDTNPMLTEKYSEIARGLSPDTNKKVVVTSYKAEEFYERLEDKFQTDIIITSPPYFAKEDYNGKNASHNQYKTSQEWVNKLLFPFSKQMNLLAKENSYACILMNDINYYDGTKEKGTGSNCIPLINLTIEAFTSNGFDFEGKVPYGTNQLKTPESCIVKREGEMFLIFKKKSTTPLSNLEKVNTKPKVHQTASLFADSSIPFFPHKRRLRFFIGSKSALINKENFHLEESTITLASKSY